MSVYTIRTSRRLRAFVVMLHLLASVAIVLAELPWLWKSGLFGLVLLGLVSAWPRQTEQRLRCGEKGDLQIWWRGAWQDTELFPETVVLPGLAVISLRNPGAAGTPLKNLVSIFSRKRQWLGNKAQDSHPRGGDEALAVSGRRHKIVVLSDSLSRDDFRRLRVWLKWKG
ncbi:MAG: hypothetical protein IPG66_12175 [Hydrogenophilales bacterium]|nr:hypothetical protein [Hydrogenophilales bacterium]